MSAYLIAGAALALATALPLAWKWQLGVLPAALVVLAASLAAGIIVSGPLAFGYGWGLAGPRRGVLGSGDVAWLLLRGGAGFCAG